VRQARFQQRVALIGNLEMDDVAKHNMGRWEEQNGKPDAEPSSWPHFEAFFPPWLALWLSWRPRFQVKKHVPR